MNATQVSNTPGYKSNHYGAFFDACSSMPFVRSYSPFMTSNWNYFIVILLASSYKKTRGRKSTELGDEKITYFTNTVDRVKHKTRINTAG